MSELGKIIYFVEPDFFDQILDFQEELYGLTTLSKIVKHWKEVQDYLEMSDVSESILNESKSALQAIDSKRRELNQKNKRAKKSDIHIAMEKLDEILDKAIGITNDN